MSHTMMAMSSKPKVATQINTVHLVRYHGLRAGAATPAEAAGPLP